MTRKVYDPVAIHNEFLKSVANLVSTLCIAVMIGSFIEGILDAQKAINLWLFGSGFALWWISPYILTYLCKEESSDDGN